MKAPRKLHWRQAIALRPDPYLAWHALTSPSAGEGWCPALIEVEAREPRATRETLERLQAMARPIAGTKPAIAITPEERHALEDAIAILAAGGPIEPDRLIFHVLMAEHALFDQGKLVPQAGFDILHLGPPMAITLREGNAPAPEPLIAASAGGAEPEVAIGIIDDGIAFAHERFRRPDGTTRIAAIWIQSLTGAGPGHSIAIGTRLTGAQIDAAIASGASERAIYRRFGRLDFTRPGHKSLALRWAHGTHVLDLAAGADPRHHAPGRPIFAVDLPPEATADSSGQTMGSYVLQGVRQIMRWADRYRPGIPLVINFSYGIFAGPKDGTSPFERALARLIDLRSRRGAATILTLPAGNSYRLRTNAHLTIGPGERHEFDWVLRPDDRTPNHIEFWIDDAGARVHGAGSDGGIRLHIAPSGGLPGAAVALKAGFSHTLSDNGRVIATVHVSRPANGRLWVVVSTAPTVRREWQGALAKPGPWRLGLSTTLDGTIAARAYVQRDDTPSGYPLRGRQSVLAHAKAGGRDPATGAYDQPEPGCPLTRRDSLSAIATHPLPLTIGAAEGATELRPSPYTSSGPTISRRVPDCAAVADRSRGRPGIRAAGTLSGSHLVIGGTSVAAPQIARLVADALAHPPAAGEGVPLRPGIELPRGAIIAVPGDRTARLGAFIVKPRSDRDPRTEF